MTDIPKMIYYKGVRYSYNPEPTPGAVAHNKVLREQNLGKLTDEHYRSISNGTFDDLYVGDYFTINNHKYIIGGFDYLYGAENNSNLGHHALIIDYNRTYNRGDTNYSWDFNNGFIKSETYLTKLPELNKRHEVDFQNHLLEWNEYLTTSTQDGIANGGDWFRVKSSVFNIKMLGSKVGNAGQYKTINKNGIDYNVGIEKDTLPIMNFTTSNNILYYSFIRDVGYSDLSLGVNGSVVYHWIDAKGLLSFFLIG